MKAEIIAKVNQIGKAGLIITRICQVCLWIGVVACILSGIVLSFIPDDMIAIHMEHKATVEVNMPEIAGTLTENGKSNTTWGDVESSLKVDDMEYGVAYHPLDLILLEGLRNTWVYGNTIVGGLNAKNKLGDGIPVPCRSASEP